MLGLRKTLAGSGGCGWLAVDSGDGLGGGVWNEVQCTLTIFTSTVTDNQATGGAAGSGGAAGVGQGGGIYIAVGGTACLDVFTRDHTKDNHALTSDDDIFGVFPGDIFVVPRGTEHRPSSTGGSILMFEPTGTSTTGDRHEGEIPAGVDSTTGHAL